MAPRSRSSGSTALVVTMAMALLAAASAAVTSTPLASRADGVDAAFEVDVDVEGAEDALVGRATATSLDRAALAEARRGLPAGVYRCLLYTSPSPRDRG